MTNYVPGSLTEIIIAHGANQDPLDPELMEIASIILLESKEAGDFENAEIEAYMK